MVNRDKLALDHGRVPDDALLDGFAEGMVCCIQSAGYGVVRWVDLKHLSLRQQKGSVWLKAYATLS